MIGCTPSKRKKKVVVTNGVLQDYLSDTETIDKNTFIEINNNKVIIATTKIEGLTKTKCTTTSAGQVYILGGGNE